MTRAKDISKIVSDANFGGTLDVAGETTLATHLNMGDSDKIKLGAGGDLEIYHNGSNSIIADVGTGDLYIGGDNLRLTNAALSEIYARGYANGAFQLYYDNSVKLATASTGVNVTGGIGLGGTGTANILDDYEQGTWTAELKGGSARASTPVISTTATYVKTGRSVFVQAYFPNVNTTGASGTMTITGLPFTAISSLQLVTCLTYGMDYDDSTAVMGIAFYIEGNNNANLIAAKDNAAWQATSITAGTGKYVAMTGTYYTNA